MSRNKLSRFYSSKNDIYIYNNRDVLKWNGMLKEASSVELWNVMVFIETPKERTIKIMAPTHNMEDYKYLGESTLVYAHKINDIGFYVNTEGCE